MTAPRSGLPALPDLPIFDRIRVGDYVHRTTVEEVAQLLGYDAADVVTITITPADVAVITRDAGDRRSQTLNRHVIR